MDTPFDTSTDTGPACRSPRSTDFRHVVVSFPFAGTRDTYGVYQLQSDGTLAASDTTFQMGRAFDGEIAFSHDGHLGVVAQDDGTLGIFHLSDEGTVSVREATYDGEAYAASVVADPQDMNVFWVLDSQTVGNGGGIYRLELDCEGAVAAERLALAVDLPYGLHFEADGFAYVFARDIGDPSANHAFHVNLDTAAVQSAAPAFPDADWIGGGSTIGTHHLFLGDVSGFSTVPNRLAVISREAFASVQVVPEVEDPVNLLLSPFEDRLLVVSGFENAFFLFDYDPTSATPLSNRREPAYTGGRPALPGAAVMIREGALRGLVLVNENQAIRRVRFEEGAVTDLGTFALGGEVPGALGVQP